METILLEEMTWPMVQEAMEQGYRTVIVAVGSIEQHGHHLPLGTDMYFGDAIAKGVAKRLGDALVAPTIRPGCSDHHLDFPGTISLSTHTLMDLVEEVCISLDGHGFENIVLVPSHGGNFAPVQTAAQSIAQSLEANIIVVADLMALIGLMKRSAAEKGVPEDAVGGHAGAGETSLVLAFKPHLVRMEEMKPGYIGPLTSRYVRTGFKAVTPTGVLGDPSRASAEIGEHILKSIVDMVYRNIKMELEG